jgi:hypothetical protein
VRRSGRSAFAEPGNDAFSLHFWAMASVEKPVLCGIYPSSANQPERGFSRAPHQ